MTCVQCTYYDSKYKMKKALKVKNTRTGKPRFGCITAGENRLILNIKTCKQEQRGLL